MLAVWSPLSPPKAKTNTQNDSQQESVSDWSTPVIHLKQETMKEYCFFFLKGCFFEVESFSFSPWTINLKYQSEQPLSPQH